MSRSVSVLYTQQSLKELRAIDQSTAGRIIKKISSNAAMTDPLTRAKALQGNFSGMYRYRIGDYRAVFIIDEDNIITLITIVTIKHRKDVYR
ncbi:type II toxin-antitoxin system mRNA interferase toxin, RelE/StbE family [Candidatus Kaiserbacteria bacterium]|nr:type II toxin-antitoxin system mRNA interferase toxin, RelE/StbE family [Candidatus Kaiserbacteria bacterium]MCB9812647.1 type II toxin-antitoxin system mRNA interferase toxin, RelE/StbE family [Candidatus Nomurabacteria bacterium]